MNCWPLVLLTGAISAANAASLQSVLDDAREAQDVPGVSAVVVRRDGVLFAGASGLADLESARPVTADSVYYAGSLSKILTAILVLQLVESKELSLDDTVEGVGRDSEPVSIAHLLTHTSGLSREGDFNYWFTADFPDSESLAQYLATASLRTRPGAALHYSNVGYAALGPVIELATGQDFSDALRTRLLQPLRMNATGAHGPAAKVTNGYTPPGRSIPSPERPFAGVGREVGTRHVRMYHDARAMSPAFGAYTSANDFGRLARFLLGHGGESVLSPASRARVFERQARGRGLGLRLERYDGRIIARHGGWFAAHRSHLLLDIDNGIGIVVLANGDNADPESIADALLETAFSASTASIALRISAAQ